MLVQPNDAMPALQHLLAKGSVTKSTQVFEAALCQALGSQKSLDWPAAAFSWLGEGHVPGNDFWLYADPVNLQLQRDYFTLNPPVSSSLTADETTGLISSLNRHFNEDGLTFIAAASGQWYLRTAAPADIATRFPGEAIGRDIRDFLPRGKDAERWQVLLNEIQMLLHEHPVNGAREERGQPVINSLWFSGAGRLPSSPSVSSRTMMAHHPLARGLALWSGWDVLPLPADFVLPVEKDILLVPKEGREDVEPWLTQIVSAMQLRKVKRLTLDIFVQDRHVQASLKPIDLLKFWRQPQPLAAYFSW